MAVTLAALILLFAVPGLLSRRRDGWTIRTATLAALVAVGLGILNLRAVTTEPLPPNLVVVPTRTAPDLTVPQRLRQLVTPAGNIQVVADHGGLATRLLAARLAAATEPELVILWNGPWQPATGPSTRAIAGPGAWALVPKERPPLDPDQVRVRLPAPWAAGRPGKVLLEMGPAPPDLWFEVTVTHPDDSTLRPQTTKDAVRATPGSPYEVQFQPKLAGPHLLGVKITTGGYTLTGGGTVPVGRATTVQVVGFEAPQLASALKVQGLVTTAHDRLPADLDGVVVLLDAVDVQDQARLLRFVDDGGGLLVVGASGGGAVPGENEPLHLILPVRRLPVDSRPPKAQQPDPKGEPTDNKPPDNKPPDNKPPDNKPPDRKPPDENPTGQLPPTKAPKRPEEKEVDRRSIAMVFLIDRSYSMRTEVAGGRTRMDFAKRATVDAAKLLRRGDQVGVVSFGNQGKGRVDVPLTDAADWKHIERQVSGLKAELEGTYAADALQKAVGLLSQSGASVRHVVVITDGEIEDTTNVGLFRALKAAEEARRARCTVSVVQVVPQNQPAGAPMVASAPAKALSDAGGGILARGRSAGVVPVVVSTEVRRTMKRAEGEETGKAPDKQPEKKPPETKEPDKPPDKKPEKQPDKQPKPQPGPGDRDPKLRRLPVRAVADSPLLEPEPDSGYPDLFGILPVRGRGDAQVLLVAGQEGIPVLAFANRGLGKVGVWTADLLGSWGREWRQAEPFPAWLAQWVEHLAPALPQPPRQLLEDRKLTPVAPLPGDVAALEDMTDGRVCELPRYPGPRPRSQVRVTRQAPDHAVFGLAALLVLLLVEFLGRMRLKASKVP